MSITPSKTANTSHYLGVDFGKAKIGLAVADSETRIAFSYGVLRNDKDLVKKMKNIIEKEEIGKIIVGITGVETLRWSVSAVDKIEPLQRKTPQRGVSTRQDKKVQGFASLLEKLNIPIEYQNEMYSTREAERNLKEKGAKRIKRFDDREAARIILQSWLDKKE